MSVVVTVDIPDWLFERLGRPDPAALARRVLEALVVDCLRTGLVTRAEASNWLDLREPSAMDAFLKDYGITDDGAEFARGA